MTCWDCYFVLLFFCVCLFCHIYSPCAICHNPISNEIMYTRVCHFNIIVLYTRVCHATLGRSISQLRMQTWQCIRASDGFCHSDATSKLIINRCDVEFMTSYISIHPITYISQYCDAAGSWNISQCMITTRLHGTPGCARQAQRARGRFIPH